MKQPQKYYIRTYGCQMNELDSEVMSGVLERRGLNKTEVEEEADLLIFNTCSIRDLAERKVMGKLGQLGRRKEMREKIIGITGCMANAKKGNLFHKIPFIDFILGTNNYHQLDQVLDDVIAGRQQVIHTDEKFSFELDYMRAKRDDKTRAYVSIIRGCDKYCTYCVVPYTRGSEVSRHPDEIVEEVKKLAAAGYQEVCLLGQNVNSYGKDTPEWKTFFHDLLYRLDKETDIPWIRFLTSHPVDISRQLMEAIRDLPSLCEMVHFPLQAGSDRILKKMHRIYTVEEYMKKVALLREIVPGVSLGTDIIVGFPTETNEDFEETYRLMEQIEYSVAYLYTYSQRKGTPAMRWKDDVPEEIKEERLQRLTRLQNGIYQKQRQNMFGEVVEVLVDGIAKDGDLHGKTRCWKNTVFAGDRALIGTRQKVKMTGYSHNTLLASLYRT